LIQRLLMLMLWTCCLSFAQEEKDELGLSLGAEFIPRAATISNQRLSFGRSVAHSVDYARRLSSGNTALLLEFPFAAGPSHRVESAQLNPIASLATLFVAPSLRAQFVSHAPASPWLSAGLGYGLYEGSSVLQNGVANTEIHRNVATAQFGGGIDLHTQLKLLFPIGFRGDFRDFYTLGNPSFGVPVRRAEQHDLVVSGGLVVHFWRAAASTSPSEYGRSDARLLRRPPELVS
jgi:hypothetical protein